MNMGLGGTKTSTESSLELQTWDIIHEYILGVGAHGLDLKKPHIRPVLLNSYKFVIFLYSLIIGIGVVANLAIFVHILKNKLYKDATHSFVLNNVIIDLIKCFFVLPVSVYVLLIQNWVLGELMCSLLPMIQDIPLHVTTLTFVLMAWDRLRHVRNPGQPRLPAFVCCFGTWLASMCLVLHYPLYIKYVDIGKYVPQLDGVGICIFNLAGDMEDYMRGIFLTMYVVPLCTISYLYIRVSRELKIRENSMGLHESRRSTESYIVSRRPSRRDFRHPVNGGYSYRSTINNEGNDSDIRPEDFEIDVLKEKRTQKYLVFTITVYFICLCPMMILRLVRLAVMETYDNSAYLDVIYTVFLWFSFAPTCVTPIVYTGWQMSRSAKDRLRDYFRFSDQKLRRSCETVVTTATETPAVSRRGCKMEDREGCKTAGQSAGASLLMDGRIHGDLGCS